MTRYKSNHGRRTGYWPWLMVGLILAAVVAFALITEKINSIADQPPSVVERLWR